MADPESFARVQSANFSAHDDWFNRKEHRNSPQPKIPVSAQKKSCHSHHSGPIRANKSTSTPSLTRTAEKDQHHHELAKNLDDLAARLALLDVPSLHFSSTGEVSGGTLKHLFRCLIFSSFFRPKEVKYFLYGYSSVCSCSTLVKLLEEARVWYLEKSKEQHSSLGSEHSSPFDMAVGQSPSDLVTPHPSATCITPIHFTTGQIPPPLANFPLPSPLPSPFPSPLAPPLSLSSSSSNSSLSNSPQPSLNSSPPPNRASNSPLPSPLPDKPPFSPPLSPIPPPLSFDRTNQTYSHLDTPLTPPNVPMSPTDINSNSSFSLSCPNDRNSPTPPSTPTTTSCGSPAQKPRTHVNPLRTASPSMNHRPISPAPTTSSLCPRSSSPTPHYSELLHVARNVMLFIARNCEIFKENHKFFLQLLSWWKTFCGNHTELNALKLRVLEVGRKKRCSFHQVINREKAKEMVDEGEIWKHSIDEIAEAMTIAEQRVMSLIQPSEFFHSSSPLNAPTITRLAKLFNSISYWVASTIVSSTMPAKTTKNFIRLGSKLIEMCNFDGAMAVLAGLSLLAVSRLKEVVWKRLDSKLEMFKEFERKLTAMDGYKVYKRMLLEVGGTRPCIPHLALYLREIMHISDGNPKVLAGEEEFDEGDEKEKDREGRIRGRDKEGEKDREGEDDTEELASEGKDSDRVEEVVKESENDETEGGEDSESKKQEQTGEVKETEKDESEEGKQEIKEDDEEGDTLSRSITFSSKIEGESEEETESTHSTESVKVERKRRTLGDKPLIYNIARIFLLGNRVNEFYYNTKEKYVCTPPEDLVQFFQDFPPFYSSEEMYRRSLKLQKPAAGLGKDEENYLTWSADDVISRLVEEGVDPEVAKKATLGLGIEHLEGSGHEDLKRVGIYKIKDRKDLLASIQKLPSFQKEDRAVPRFFTTNVANWNSDEVCQWLDYLGHEKEVMKAFRKANIDGRGLLKKLNKIKLSEMGVKKLSERHLILEEVEKIQNNWGYFQLPDGVVPVVPPSSRSPGGDDSARNSPGVAAARGEGSGVTARRGLGEEGGEEGVAVDKGGMGDEGGEGKERGKKGKKDKKAKKDKDEKRKSIKSKSKSNLKPLLTHRKTKEEGDGAVVKNDLVFSEEDDEEELVPHLVTFRFSQGKKGAEVEMVLPASITLFRLRLRLKRKLSTNIQIYYMGPEGRTLMTKDSVLVEMIEASHGKPVDLILCSKNDDSPYSPCCSPSCSPSNTSSTTSSPRSPRSSGASSPTTGSSFSSSSSSSLFSNSK